MADETTQETKAGHTEEVSTARTSKAESKGNDEGKKSAKKDDRPNQFVYPPQPTK